MLKNVYLAGCARTPIGTFNGALADVPAAKLGAEAVKASISRAGIGLDDVDEVYFGNVIGAGLGQNIARQVAIGAGLPVTCGGMTINKVCGSSMRAIVLAAQAIQCGDADLVMAGGVESMSRAPYLLPDARKGMRLGNRQAVDAMIHDGLWDVYNDVHMGTCGDACSKEHGISREEQDAYAIESFRRVIAAQEEGYFSHTIAPIELETRKGKVVIDRDEEPTKFVEEKVRKLRPAFGATGSVTAANASSISDGAAAAVVVGEERAKALGIGCSARILGHTNVAMEPTQFPVAPIYAIRRLCDDLNLKIEDVDLFEINEAFSVVTMIAIRELNLDPDKVNVFGGAVAIGHPIGATGARIVATLINALQVREKKIGIATLCIGGGEASAIAVERC